MNIKYKAEMSEQGENTIELELKTKFNVINCKSFKY